MFIGGATALLLQRTSCFLAVAAFGRASATPRDAVARVQAIHQRIT
jgi:hypothetical protein